jgi:hypothetical protein
MSKLNYELDQETRNIIIELYKKAKSLNIGNINFKYYATTKSKEVDFYLTEYKYHWELTVMTDNKMDIYKIENDTINYEVTEIH